MSKIPTVGDGVTTKTRLGEIVAVSFSSISVDWGDDSPEPQTFSTEDFTLMVRNGSLSIVPMTVTADVSADAIVSDLKKSDVRGWTIFDIVNNFGVSFSRAKEVIKRIRNA